MSDKIIPRQPLQDGCSVNTANTFGTWFAEANLDELKQAALAAVPGPWTSQSGYPRMIVSETEKWTHYDDCGNPEFTGPAWVCNVGDSQNNADFISLANPAVVLELIAQLEAANEKLLVPVALPNIGITAAPEFMPDAKVIPIVVAHAAIKAAGFTTSEDKS
ncbi:ead/Ea22-like family protein [Yersinia pekkanenii]|uniref:Uncharacterized protein n=1 Tax=Yersinia pekkanenii TaxID=1288385 RepID=A0A0T9R7T4_9GAMM|nr:hypothetical protein [Yersinia pekkanenii]CNI46527.1 Uncharacterised protein [Yersinia pekkanenii]CRY65743.1 Uncharacterised protein [Yersinia pekkanenii]